MEGSWDEYLKKMERDGEYADHVIIQFTAKYLQREILIVTSSPGSKNANRENVIINEEDGRNGCPLLLGHVYENHYESLQMKDEAELEMDCGNASDGWEMDCWNAAGGREMDCWNVADELEMDYKDAADGLVMGYWDSVDRW